MFTRQEAPGLAVSGWLQEVSTTGDNLSHGPVPVFPSHMTCFLTQASASLPLSTVFLLEAAVILL
jgi:hypothetical protein